MSDLGFDEGGVLKALATPIIHHEVTTTRTTKKGKQKVTRTAYELTGAHVVALLLGKGLLALFYKYKDLSEEEKQYVQDLLIYGPLPAYLRKKTSEAGTTPGKTIEQMQKKWLQ